jgi:drug/metabolite transporter (DMT)-like permease
LPGLFRLDDKALATGNWQLHVISFPSVPSPLRLHSALFTVALLFSINYIISKLAMRELSPLSFAWLRIAGAAIVLALVARNEPRLSREDLRRVALFAVLGVATNATLFLVGLSLTTVQVAAILITTIPVFALGTAIIAGQERATAMRVGGIALACVGALLAVGGESFTGTWRSFLGAVLIVVNCLSYSLYLVISKPFMATHSARSVVKMMFAIGAVVLFPVAAYSLFTENWGAVSSAAWLSLAFVIAGPTVAAYLLNAWALRHADSSVVAAYTYVQPILATFLGALVFGEQIRAIVLVAGAMIFAGVALAGRASGPVPE